MKRLGSILIALFLARAATAQDSTRYASPVGGKSVGAAVGLSFLLPGLGQAYADEGERGVAFMVISGIGAGMAVAGLRNVETCENVPFGGGSIRSCNKNTSNPGVGVAGVVVLTVSWVASMVDAASAVHRYRQKHGLETASIVPFVDEQRAARRVGLAVRIPR